MKIIDLLNKIAKGEEVPKKIIWSDDEYKYHKTSNSYICDYSDIFTDIDGTNLNDEVEIVEEYEEYEDIEELDVEYDDDGRIDGVFMARPEVEERKSINALIRNQKKIIEELKKLKEEK